MPRATGSPDIAGIADGVFFTVPERLPRGRHGLSREEVRAAQRERLMAAATELLAALGYRGFGATDIAKRAGVSLQTFYACFEDKEACIFAGYDRFIDVLLRRMVTVDDSLADGRAALVQRLTGTYFAALREDLVVARAYQVEVDALGPAARARRRDSLKLFANFIGELVSGHERAGAVPVGLPPTGYIGVVYAARQLAADALEVGDEPDLIQLEADLQLWFFEVFRER